MKTISALIAGVLFGAGLLMSRMCDPQRVLAFLDVTGHWNPALAFTMAGALIVAAPAYHFVRWRGADLLKQPMHLPDRFRIDRHLLTGGAVFGVGWGLSGICPGPSLLLAAAGHREVWAFMAMMFLGFMTAKRIKR